ncbi:hypothetical protein FBU59_003613, partial [Linderina macrospora]
MHITSPSFAFLALTLTLTQSAIADISDYGKWWKDISDTDLKKIVIDHDPPTYLTNRYTIWSTNFQSFSTRNTTGLTTETMQYAIVKNSGTLTPNVNYVSAYIYMTPLNRTLSVEGATFSYFQCTGDGSEESGKIEESQCEKQNKIGTWVVRKDEELGSVDVTELVFGGKMTVEERRLFGLLLRAVSKIQGYSQTGFVAVARQVFKALAVVVCADENESGFPPITVVEAVQKDSEDGNGREKRRKKSEPTADNAQEESVESSSCLLDLFCNVFADSKSVHAHRY